MCINNLRKTIVNSIVSIVLIGGLVLPDAVFSMPEPRTSTLAVWSSFVPIVDIVPGIKDTLNFNMRERGKTKNGDDNRKGEFWRHIGNNSVIYRRSNGSLRGKLHELLDNAYDSIVDRIDDLKISPEKYTAKITITLKYRDNDIVLTICDNGKPVTFGQDGRPTQRYRDPKRQFGGVGHGNIYLAEGLVKQEKKIVWEPLADGTRVSLKLPKEMTGVFPLREKEVYITEEPATLQEVSKGFRKDTEIRYFNLLKEKAGELGLSQAGLRDLVKEHLGDHIFDNPNAVLMGGEGRSRIEENDRETRRKNESIMRSIAEKGILSKQDLVKNKIELLSSVDGSSVRPGSLPSLSCVLLIEDVSFPEQRPHSEVVKETLFDEAYGALQILMERETDEERSILHMNEGELRTLLAERARHGAIFLINPDGLSEADAEQYLYQHQWGTGAREVPYLHGPIHPEAIEKVIIPAGLKDIAERTFPKDKIITVEGMRDETFSISRREDMYGGTKRIGWARKRKTVTLKVPDYETPLVEELKNGRGGAQKSLLLHATRLVASSDLSDAVTNDISRKETVWGQTFIDTTLIRAYAARSLYAEGKIESPYILIGVETSWIPDEQLPYIQELLNKLGTLSKEKGLENLIIRRGKGGSLAHVLEREASKSGITNSNVIILGDNNVIDSDRFNSFRKGADPEKWAFFAGVELPEGFPPNNYIRLFEMLTNALNLWSGKPLVEDTRYMRIVREGKRIYKFIMPEIEAMDYELLKKIYENQLEAMRSA